MEKGGGIIEYVILVPKSEAVTASKNWGGLCLLVQWQLSPSRPFTAPQ